MSSALRKRQKLVERERAILHMPFIKRNKRKGLRIEPWEMPDVMSVRDEEMPFRHYCSSCSCPWCGSFSIKADYK